jgi:cysteine desulfurase
MTLSSNDMYGPKGVGALYVKDGLRIEPLIHGGGQEKGLRSGTENIPGIVGFGKAAEIARQEMQVHVQKLTKLRDRFMEGLLGQLPYTFLNGHPTKGCLTMYQSDILS